MRKNRKYSANELIYFINLYLIDGISCKELIKDYGLNINRNTFLKYIRRFRQHGPSALFSTKKQLFQ